MVKDRAAQAQSPSAGDYRLWLVLTDHGRITITGWSEGSPNGGGPVSYWPEYPLCESIAQLPERLAEFGLELAPGAALTDLGRAWDVYVQHPDVTALRTALTRRDSTPRD